ncbi:MAG: DUF721 domain-containing protein [Planctomycetia bacterium]|nr:DUF721 domain-containing protein [Planctomycetia bacterium]
MTQEKPWRPRAVAIQDVLSGILTRYGVGRNRSEDDLAEFWQSLAGELAPYTRIGALKRGVLEILVTDSLFVQELTFRKQELLRKFQEAYPDNNIRDLRFKVQ